MNPRAHEELFVATTPGLEAALLDELRVLGVGGERVTGGALVRGPASTHLRLNLWLRSATRVLWRLTRIRALAQEVSALPPGLLRPFVSEDAEVRVSGPRALVSAFCRRMRVRARAAREVEDETDDPLLLVSMHLQGAHLDLRVDTTGRPLYKRGYREEVGRAPMRETLAAGLLGLSGYSGDEPLIDPLCGSGTIPIEAALLASRRAPGALGRSFAFERFPHHDGRAWAAMRELAAREARPPPQSIHASDLNAGALGIARRNARRAGVLPHVSFSRLDLDVLVPPVGLSPGLIAANLPYGKRVEERGVRGARASLMRLLEGPFAGWRFALLSKAGDEAPWGGAPIPLSNGGLACVLRVGRAC